MLMFCFAEFSYAMNTGITSVKDDDNLSLWYIDVNYRTFSDSSSFDFATARHTWYDKIDDRSVEGPYIVYVEVWCERGCEKYIQRDCRMQAPKEEDRMMYARLIVKHSGIKVIYHYDKTSLYPVENIEVRCNK